MGRARGTLGQEIQDRVASRRHDSSSPPQRRRGSSSSSPSPARDRNQGKEDSSEHTSKDGGVRAVPHPLQQEIETKGRKILVNTQVEMVNIKETCLEEMRKTEVG